MMSQRDPQAKWRFFWSVCAVGCVIPLLGIAHFEPSLLLDPHNLHVMGQFLIEFFPPRIDSEFVALLIKATLETLAMATAGMALAVLFSAPLALAIARNFSVSRIGGRQGRVLGKLIRSALRIIMLLLRGMPELVWALIWVRVFGLGTAAGVMAIAFTYSGLLAKVYSDILDSSSSNFAQALMLEGSGRIAAFCYGALPECSQELASYTVYRWECAVRVSVVMGFVGAGGLGQLMDQSMKMLSGGEVSSILIVFLALVLFADALSYIIRQQLK